MNKGISMKENYIFATPGQKCFEVTSNFTNYLELGIREKTKYYLLAKIENDEFKISGVLLDKNGNVTCHLKDNDIVTSKALHSLHKKMLSKYGYRISDKEENLIFEIQIENELICHIRSTIYGELGDIVAQYSGGKFIILKGPAIIGKSGNSVGIKIG